MAESSPLVTVLTPTYNRRDFLLGALACVRAQTYPNIEHIVLDGGSTDGTIELLRIAQAKWGVRWISGPDGGMYEALNAGLKMVEGPIVSWINSDDRLLPWAVETAVAHRPLREGRAAVYGDVLSMSAGSTVAQVQMYPGFSRNALSAGATLAQPTVFWPTWATRQTGGLDTGTYRQLADCDYWLRLSLILPFHKIRELQGLVYNHAGTKREVLAGQVTEELDAIRKNYGGHLLSPRSTLSLHALRQRWEWLMFLVGPGWANSRRSSMLAQGWTRRRLTTAYKTGPQRRHPYTGPATAAIGVDGLLSTFRELGEELTIASTPI